MNNAKYLKIRMKSQSKIAWNSLLQKGFFLEGMGGMTIRQFLIESLGYDNCLIDDSVRTIFLNSSPVDDIDGATIKDNDRIALGSAMPGLVGICMGRDNPYKEFRSDIACKGNGNEIDTAQVVRLFVKIFSTLAVDTGEDVLKRGIQVDAHILADLFEQQSEHLVDDGGVSSLSTKSGETVRIAVEFI